ncbi:MAG: YciI family protein [Vicinamibacteria bacterium]
MMLLALACALAQAASPAAPAPARANDVFAATFRTGPAWDQAKAPQDQAHFAAHSQNLRALRAEGRLLLGGRYGALGLVVLRAASLDEARSLVERDPSVKAGTFAVEVEPFHPFMPGCVGEERPAPK